MTTTTNKPKYYGATDDEWTPPPSARDNDAKSNLSPWRNPDDNSLFSRPLVRVALASLALVGVIGVSSIPFQPTPSYTQTASSVMNKEVVEAALSFTLPTQDEPHDEDQELYYTDQLLNHFPSDTTTTTSSAKPATWTNRYWKSTTYFRGPGHPIFVIVGGEGALTKMLYPFITHHLAPRFGAAVIQIEHRFYGTEPYRPIVGREATNQELLELLTPQQAMADMIRLTKLFKEQLNCGAKYDRASEHYCPVITVGGSYPGFLSAVLRLKYSDVVDMSYASSAPLKLYGQMADQYSYYDIVTRAADVISPGCANAVRTTLAEASNMILGASSVEEAVEGMGMCVDTLPDCIDSVETLQRDVMMAVAFNFANYDMDAYPPSKDLGFYKACRVFQKQKGTPFEKVGNFFQLMLDTEQEFASSYDFNDEQELDCFDFSMYLPLPDGPNTCVLPSESSGTQADNEDKMWDFQLCSILIDPIGTSPESMFPPRDWTYDDLASYCRIEYGEDVVPRPYALVEDLGFDDLVGNGASRILFTNGMLDMWSSGSYLEDLSDSILALNFENGAHHSDLSHVGPSDNDTEDIKAGFVTITNILEKWLNEVKAEAKK